jgi:hypothetical protein
MTKPVFNDSCDGHSETASIELLPRYFLLGER